MSDTMQARIAVIGAGHAGIEAALAAARMGVDTVLFTLSLDAVANMPCNPSVGGTAKGHLVYEIDALGGEMGYAADRVTLQSRTLNAGKGAAVQSKRVQADRRAYQALMKHTLETTPHLRLVQAEIVELLTCPCPGLAEGSPGPSAHSTENDNSFIICKTMEVKTGGADGPRATVSCNDRPAAQEPTVQKSGTPEPGAPAHESPRPTGAAAGTGADIAGIGAEITEIGAEIAGIGAETGTAGAGIAEIGAEPDTAGAEPDVPAAGTSLPRRVCGVVTRLGERWDCDCVIVATGTYLDSAVFVGDVSYAAGPDGLLPARGLSASLREAGVRLLRFKTGTPARVSRASIDFSQLEEQPGEPDALPFSVRTPPEEAAPARQLPCHIVYTNAETHRVIRENLTRSAMYSGKIHGTGPRYCPSIEDKLVRFADKPRHQLFVEPMGRETEEMYLQGFSTSLPTDVQRAMLRTLPGFGQAQIMRYAYAIEYDCADPTQMDATLEFKDLRGLYGAGQFNGTSGYEEAAAQGLVAGINAALRCLGREPVVLGRFSGYIGTLIDDLVTKGTNEPYRMMTSRSEYRLLLRQDNADLRLTPIGHAVGLVPEDRWAAFLVKKARQEAEVQRLERTVIPPAAANPFLLAHGESEVKSGVPLADLLRRPGLSYAALAEIDPARPALTPAERLTVESDVKYAGYAARQLADVARQSRLEQKALPPGLDYTRIRGLRIEAAQKLAHIRPRTLGQASRISGVNPADISVLMIYLGIR